MADAKACRGCQKVKPLTEFYPIDKDDPNGRRKAQVLDERSRATHSPIGIPKLSPGQRREGQIAEDRIVHMWAEVGKCRDCATHHQHGHACTHCGHPVDGQAPEPLDNRGTCTCPHPARRHDPESGCLLDCECSGYPEAVAS